MTEHGNGQLKSGTDHEGALAALARACARHAWRTIGAWVVVAIVIVGAVATFGGTLVDEFTIPDSDAQRATDLLEQRFPARSGDSATLVFAVPEGTLRAPEAKAAVQEALAEATAIPGVEAVGDPFAGTDGALSEDGRIARADVQFGAAAFDIPKSDIVALQDDARAAVAGTDVQVEFTGQVIQAAQEPSSSTSELLGLLAAIIILIFLLEGSSPPACPSCSRSSR